MGSHHIGRVWKAQKHDVKPWHAQCDCGTAGDFYTEGEAVSYLETHFNRNGGICTSELLKGDPLVKPAPKASAASADGKVWHSATPAGSTLVGPAPKATDGKTWTPATAPKGK
jgi:hypothetical protein